MNRRTLYWAGAAIVASVSVGRVSQSKAASPGAARASSDSVHLACPDVPSDAPPIAGVKTAWAISSSSSSAIRLLFSDQSLACRDPDWHKSPMGNDDCIKSWQFAFRLPPHYQKPGVYDLHDYEADYAEAVTVSLPEQGCGSRPGCTGMAMGSAGGGKGPESTVEIYSVTESCVTGRIHRLSRGVDNSDVDFTGVFQAAVCAPSAP
jgi:hypothetical protein